MSRRAVGWRRRIVYVSRSRCEQWERELGAVRMELDEALVEALRGGVIAGAGLDVYEDEPRLHAGLTDCDNVLLLNHLGSSTHGTRRAMSRLAAANLLRPLAGARPAHGINPQVLRWLTD